MIMEKNQDALIMADGAIRYEGLRRLCLETGVDDVGFVDIDRPGLVTQKNMILEVFPETHHLPDGRAECGQCPITGAIFKLHGYSPA